MPTQIYGVCVVSIIKTKRNATRLLDLKKKNIGNLYKGKEHRTHKNHVGTCDNINHPNL